MEKKVFNVDINAPREKVWEVLWGEKSYPAWTAVFSADSGVKTDWKKGSKVLFVDGQNRGMVSRIADLVPNEYMSFEHLGFYDNGKEDFDSEKVKEWAGTKENYRLSGQNGKTELSVELDIDANHADFFVDAFPKALQKVKELSEQN